MGISNFFPGIALNRDCSCKPKGQIPSVPEQHGKTHSWFTSVFGKTHLYYSPKLFPLSLSSHISPSIQPICHLFDDSSNRVFSQRRAFRRSAPRVGPCGAAPAPHSLCGETRFRGFKTADFQARFDKLPGLIPVQGSKNQGREFEPQL